MGNLDDIPVHVINLPHRTDRKEKIIQELKTHNITNYTFVDAIHGDTLNVDQMLEDKLVDFKHRRLKKGEYGCYLSHLKVYKSILESSDELHLIIEDDAHFVKHFKDRFNRILKKVESSEWDVFYLGVNCDSENYKQGKVLNKTLGLYYPDNPVWGTHGYLIKKETIKKIENILSPITLPIDVFLMSIDIKRLTLFNTIIKTSRLDSDTQSIK